MLQLVHCHKGRGVHQLQGEGREGEGRRGGGEGRRGDGEGRAESIEGVFA